PPWAGHVPNERSALRLPARLRDRDRRSAHLLPCPEPRTGGRALPGAAREDFLMAAKTQQASLFDPALLRPAVKDSFLKLSPKHMAKNPVMFVVEVGSVLTTALWIRDLFSHQGLVPLWFTGAVTLWLWFTVVFANFAEAVAEGRGKA